MRGKGRRRGCALYLIGMHSGRLLRHNTVHDVAPTGDTMPTRHQRANLYPIGHA